MLYQPNFIPILSVKVFILLPNLLQNNKPVLKCHWSRLISQSPVGDSSSEALRRLDTVLHRRRRCCRVFVARYLAARSGI